MVYMKVLGFHGSVLKLMLTLVTKLCSGGLMYQCFGEITSLHLQRKLTTADLAHILFVLD